MFTSGDGLGKRATVFGLVRDTGRQELPRGHTQALFDQLDADASGAIDLNDVLVRQAKRGGDASMCTGMAGGAVDGDAARGSALTRLMRPLLAAKDR